MFNTDSSRGSTIGQNETFTAAYSVLNEPQAPAPSGGFLNSSFSGAFSAGTVAPSITANVNATGLATLDGTGNFA